MNGNRASGLKKGYSGPSLHGSNVENQKGIATKGDFRQASHTIQKMCYPETLVQSRQEGAFNLSAACGGTQVTDPGAAQREMWRKSSSVYEKGSNVTNFVKSGDPPRPSTSNLSDLGVAGMQPYATSTQGVTISHITSQGMNPILKRKSFLNPYEREISSIIDSHFNQFKQVKSKDSNAFYKAKKYKVYIERDMVPRGFNQAFHPQISKIPQGKVTHTSDFKKDVNQLSLLFSMSLQQVMYKHWILEHQSCLDSMDAILTGFIESISHLPETERSKALARYKEQCLNAEQTVFKNLCKCLKDDLNATRSKTYSAPCALTDIQIKQLLGTDTGPVYASLLNCTKSQTPIGNPKGTPATNTGNVDHLNLPSSLKLAPNGIANDRTMLKNNTDYKQVATALSRHSDSTPDLSLTLGSSVNIKSDSPSANRPLSAGQATHVEKLNEPGLGRNLASLADCDNHGTPSQTVHELVSPITEGPVPKMMGSNIATLTTPVVQQPFYQSLATPLPKLISPIAKGPPQKIVVDKVATPTPPALQQPKNQSPATPLSEDIKIKADKIKLLKEKIMLENSQKKMSVGNQTKRKASHDLARSPEKMVKLETPTPATLKRKREDSQSGQGGARKKLNLED